MQKQHASPTPRAASCFGQIECVRNGWSFEEVFRYQFHVSRGNDLAAELCDKWNVISFAGWKLQHCPKLPVCRVINKTGKPIAVILGVAISPNGQCLPEEQVFEDSEELFETWLEELSGRFVVLASINGHSRFYLDPAGNLATVYEPKRKIIASSVYLTVPQHLEPHPNIDIDLVLDRKERFVFGETSDQRVVRARPNHYIDLDDFSEIRHWPRTETPFAELDRDRSECVAEISDRLSKNINALTSKYGCGLPVTAGMDSRIILACAVPYLSRINSFYCYRLNHITKIDAAAAVRLAEQLSVPMLIISRRSPAAQTALPASFDDDEHGKMLLRTGKCFGVRKDWARYVALTPPLDVVLRGTGLEMTRANKWTEASSSVPCNPVEGLRTLTGLRAESRRTPAEQHRYDHLLAEYHKWAETLPEPAHERLYDLAHVELMLPSGPVLEYSAYATHFVVNPFNDRRLYQLTAAIAPRARIQKRIVRKIIARFNPHLLNIPFHRDWVD